MEDFGGRATFKILSKAPVYKPSYIFKSYNTSFDKIYLKPTLFSVDYIHIYTRHLSASTISETDQTTPQLRIISSLSLENDALMA